MAELVKQEIQRVGKRASDQEESKDHGEVTADSDREAASGYKSQQRLEAEKIQRALAKMKRMDVKLNELMKVGGAVYLAQPHHTMPFCFLDPFQRERDVKRQRKLLEQQSEAIGSGSGLLNHDTLIPSDCEEGN